MRIAFFWMLAITQTAWALDGNAILEQVDKNMSPKSYEGYRKLINVDPDGGRREFVLYTVHKGRDKMAALFLSPATDRGRTMLRLGDNLWFHIPNVPRPLRVGSLQSAVGGIMSNADIMRIRFSAEYDVESVEVQEGNYILSLKARGPWVAYDHLKMWVDRGRLLPVTIEAYGASGLLLKVLRFSHIKDFGDGIVRPSVVEAESPLRAGHKCVILFANFRKRNLSDEIFTVGYLPRFAELR